MSALNKLSSLFRREDGAATIEAIIVLPLAVSLMAGVVEFGRIYSTYSSVDKSMRSAARYLARVSEGNVCSTWALTRAQNLAVYGNVAGGTPGSELVPGWDPLTVTLSQPNCGAPFPDPLVIELQASVPFTVNMFSVIGFSNSMNLNVRHEERHIGE